MNIQEVQALTDEEIRVKIAELVGTHTVTVLPLDGGTMTHVTDEKGRIRQIRQMDDGPRAESYPRDWTAPPNYPADLNACHDVERTLTIDQASEYREDLIYVMATAAWQSHGAAGDYDYHATARQRCEALILTISGQ